MAEERSRDFIRQVIDEDMRTGKYDGRVHTRFPPEPTGYLHIGHAKAIMLNYGIAQEYGGLFNLRFDDTNPVGEEEEFVKAIIEDAKWLGADWGNRLFFASDYFDKMYEYAVQLVKQGDAYVDDLSAMEIKHYRGNVVKPGTSSPHRDRSIEENLDLLERMKAGEFRDGERVLRAKIDMAHPNMNMRDPLIYRILHATHHNTGDKWCIYPMYDWAHGLEDSIEGITHSLCSIEFENHRPLYDWFLIKLGVYRPIQIEFARLNMTNTVMSKRWLRQLVEEGHVSGWDDPRMPTVRAMRRRGYTAEAIRDFLDRVGITKKENVIAIELLEHCVREHLNRVAPRFMGVLDPLKVIIENHPEDEVEEMDAVNNPEDPDVGTRKLPFSKELYIERDDFMEEPPKKYYRLAPGREVRFRYAYFVTCRDVIKENDEVVGLRCTIDPKTRGGDSPDGRKVKSTIHWVSAKHAIDAEVRLYEKLFTEDNPSGHGGDFKSFLNPDSLTVLKDCKVESVVGNLSPGDRFQFERLGYFCIDPDTKPGTPVINRAVTLRDTWAKIQKQQGSA
jgi:glutaminyl-tRNA synthetase